MVSIRVSASYTLPPLARSIRSCLASISASSLTISRSADSINKHSQCTCLAPINNTDKSHPSLISTISLEELNEVTKNFSNDFLIGEGRYAKCFLGVLKDGQNSAVKKLDTSAEIEVQVTTIFRMCYHDNIVQLLGYFLEGNTRVLAYEYAPRGSLHHILHGKKGVKDGRPGLPLSWLQRVKIAISAAKGLEFLHEKFHPPIIHRNIKSSKILLFDNDVAKIGDIGVSPTPHMDDLNNPVHRPGWSPEQPPECAMFGTYSIKGDVYSFGIILLELLTGRKAMDYTMPRGRQSLVTWATPRLSEDKVKQCIDPRLGREYPRKAASKMAAVAALCLHYDPESRPGMSIVVRALSPLLKSE